MTYWIWTYYYELTVNWLNCIFIDVLIYCYYCMITNNICRCCMCFMNHVHCIRYHFLFVICLNIIVTFMTYWIWIFSQLKHENWLNSIFIDIWFILVYVFYFKLPKQITYQPCYPFLSSFNFSFFYFLFLLLLCSLFFFCYLSF